MASSRPSEELDSSLPDLDLKGGWIESNRAILVIHGIGNQRALQTLDAFGQGLVKSIRSMTGKIVTVEHRVQSERDQEARGVWFNNYLRLRPEGEPSAPYIDVYEYYWAYLTEDKAKFGDIRDWVRGVIKQARTFYGSHENEALCKLYEPNSYFFSGGTFHSFRYKWFLYMAGLILPAIQAVGIGIVRLLSRIPIIGSVLADLVKLWEKGEWQTLGKGLGDIAIYNTFDEKSKFSFLRREIMNGSISAIQDLIEPEDASDAAGVFKQWKYEKVILAGHSLGSEIGYDAVNRINYLIQEGQIRGVNENGTLANDKGTHIADLLAGLITFGSPLDKAAFFLRDQAPPGQLLRASIIEDFYGFRQKQWVIPDPRAELRKNGVVFNSQFRRLFETIPWRNYYDKYDPISGCLDLYSGVTNVPCHFNGSLIHITHSKYWTCDLMFDEIYSMLCC